LSWIRDDWRLKLLALGLAVLMLGAVAFSQNPPTSKTMQLGIVYTVPSSLIVINPPTRTTVVVTGPADLVSAANGSNIQVTADLTKASAGTGEKVNLVGKAVISGVSVQTTPVVLNIDQRAAVKLTVTPRAPRGSAPGWQVTKMAAFCPNSPCSITFDGPVSWEANLKAYVDYPYQVNGTVDYPSLPVVLERNDIPLDLKQPINATVPQANIVDSNAVSIHIEAKAGTTSRQVVLVDSPPSNPPPTCYRVTGIAIDPVAVIIAGSPDALTNITTITLPAVDLSHSTSNATFRVTIPYPDTVNGPVGTARVTYSISQNPNCASPSP
jgi:YbbR domain-containing protein